VIRWIPIIGLLVAFTAVAMTRERRRVSGVERWARAKGFIRPIPFAPDAASPAVALTARFHERGARLWGIALEGESDGVPCTIAEYAALKPGKGTEDQWFTLVFWPMDEHLRDLDTWPHEGMFIREDGYAGWQLAGTLTAARLQHLLDALTHARKLIAINSAQPLKPL